MAKTTTHASIIQVGDKGVRVWARGKKSKGVTTGATRTCMMEGCLGRRVGVLWEDGKHSYPCSKGMDIKGNAWIIL